MVVARTLLTPDWDDPVQYLSEVGQDPARSDLGASVAIVASTLFIPVAIGLAALARDRHPGVLYAGAAVIVIGCIGMVSISTATLVAGRLVRLRAGATATTLWNHVWNDPTYASARTDDVTGQRQGT